MAPSNKSTLYVITKFGNVERVAAGSRANTLRRLAAVDMVAARTYFRGVSSLAAEAANSQDLRVINTALRVMELQKLVIAGQVGA